MTFDTNLQYQHGDDYQGKLKANFSSNVWYDAQHQNLYTHLKAKMPLVARYPENENKSLKLEFCEKNKCNPNEILLTNGSTEGIYLIAQAFRKSTSLILSPSFSEYQRACEINHHAIKFFKAQTLSAELASTKPNLVWLCVPNNPDGYLFDTELIEKLMSDYSDTIFIIDISFTDFCTNKPPYSLWIRRFKNLVLLYSFTKRYGIPGLRLGYLHCNENILCKVNTFAIPWSVNVIASEALRYIMNVYTDDFDIEKWLQRKTTFCNQLNQINGLKCVESTTPFFLVKLEKATSSELKKYLLEKEILIRDAANFFTNGEQYIRLLTLTDKKNTLLINELRQWMQQF
jgi:threonine-phosphate decarboxylase